jgi:S1-C subfamily serine protease
MSWESRQGRLAIGNVSPNSAAAQIGLQAGDQVASIGGQNISNEQQFHTAMRDQFNRFGGNGNYRIPIVVYRNGNPTTLYWTWAALALAGYGPLAPGWRGGYYGNGYYADNAPYQTGYRGAPNQSSAFLGVDLDQRSRNAAIVERVYPGSPAEKSGMQPGDVIWNINNEPINSPQEVSFVIGQMQPGQAVEIRFGRPTQVQAVLAQRGASGDLQPQPAAAPGIQAPAPSTGDQPPGNPTPQDASPRNPTP